MFWKETAVSAVSSTPVWMMALVLVTISAALWAASLLLEARFRTSSATTAKPLPAAPALAASTAAFRARMLVWKAMSSMVLMMPPIWLEDSSMFLVAAVSWAIFVSAWAA